MQSFAPYCLRSLRIVLPVVAVLALIVFVFAEPKMPQARREARQFAAIRAIRTIRIVQGRFLADHGRYAGSLPELVDAQMIGANLSQGPSHGYRFTLTGTQNGYVIRAEPENRDPRIGLTYCSDETGALIPNCGADPLAPRQ